MRRQNARGFTLVEMLIVVVVLVTLMSITFRLMSIGDTSERRVTTVMRLQKLENCLSGYNAAFGSYPPVKLHGSQDFNFAVDGHGIQMERSNIDWNNDNSAWRQIEAACRAQPIAARYPFSRDFGDIVNSVADEIKERLEKDPDWAYLKKPGYESRYKALSSGFDSLSAGNEGRFGGSLYTEQEWRQIQLFQFGLMSYLLPRYLFMMNGPESFFQGQCALQWSGNNTLPSNPFTGETLSSWKEVREMGDESKTANKKDLLAIANIPSQTVCARWMPNLADLCRCNHNYTFFGISIHHSGGLAASPEIEIFSPNPNTTENQYILDSVTVVDGWGREFYYYSPPPYQTYTLWSAGPNGRTFPPWVSRSDIANSEAQKLAAKWSVDDIIHMNN